MAAAKKDLPIDWRFPDDANYYEVLGVSEAATAAEIKKSYRLRSLEHHPDKHPDRTYATENFQRVGAAHDALSNPELRGKYDHDRWTADMGINTSHPMVQQFCRQHFGNRFDYVDMEPWIDAVVLARLSALRGGMASGGDLFVLPCKSAASAEAKIGLYLASASSDEISRIKGEVHCILDEFRGDVACEDGVTILLPPDLRRGPGVLQKLQQNFHWIQKQTQVRMNLHMVDRVVIWGPLKGRGNRIDAVSQVQEYLQWRGVILIWSGTKASRGNRVSTWEYLTSVEETCPTALSANRLPAAGLGDPTSAEALALLRRLLPKEVVEQIGSESGDATDVESRLLELLLTTTLSPSEGSDNPVVSRLLGVAKSVQARRKRAEQAGEARQRWELEQKQRALKEAKARAMGLADKMLRDEAEAGNGDAIRILAEDFLRAENEEEKKRLEMEAKRKAEEDAAREMAENARKQAFQEAQQRALEVIARKKRAEELARNRIAEEVKQRKEKEEAQQKARQDELQKAQQGMQGKGASMNGAAWPSSPPGLSTPKAGQKEPQKAAAENSEHLKANGWQETKAPATDDGWQWNAHGWQRAPWKSPPNNAEHWNAHSHGESHHASPASRSVSPYKQKKPDLVDPPGIAKPKASAAGSNNTVVLPGDFAQGQPEEDGQQKTMNVKERLLATKRKAEQDQVEEVQKRRIKLAEVNKQKLKELKARLLEEADGQLREAKIHQTF